MPTIVRHRTLSAFAGDAIDNVRKAIAAAVNTFPRALNRSMFFISRPPCGTRMLLALSDRIGPIIERWPVRIIPVHGSGLARHSQCCWKRSIEYVRCAATDFPHRCQDERCHRRFATGIHLCGTCAISTSHLQAGHPNVCRSWFCSSAAIQTSRIIFSAPVIFRISLRCACLR